MNYYRLIIMINILIVTSHINGMEQENTHRANIQKPKASLKEILDALHLPMPPQTEDTAHKSLAIKTPTPRRALCAAILLEEFTKNQ